MIDLETLSERQNAVVVQIGAVEFDFNTEKLGKEFLLNVDVDSCLKNGLHISKSTVEWWGTQPKEVRDSWKKSPVILVEAISSLTTWVSSIGEQNDIMVWANGSVFDLGILRYIYDILKVERPWKHWNEMDVRTVSNILEVRLSSGNTHNALEDCKNQASQLIKFLKG